MNKKRLRELLDYDLNTGIFRWRVTRSKAKEGDICDTIDSKGYIQVRLDSVTYRVHRLSFMYVLGRWPHDQTDHINRDRKDNRWINLQDSNPQHNAKNRHEPKRPRDPATGQFKYK